MSKQSEAKEKQGYVAKAPKTCGNCANFTCDLELPAWMARLKVDPLGRPYSIEEYGHETNKRCGLGGFAVKKSGTCNEFSGKSEEPS